MIEIFLIIFQLFIFILFFSFNFMILNKNFLQKIDYNFLENFTFNVIIQSNLILVLSFLNLKLDEIIYFCLLFNSIIFVIYLIKWKKAKLKIKKIDFSIFFFIFICLIIFFDISYNLVLGWDVEKFWVYKTLNFYNDRSIENLENYARPNYPYFGSLLWAFFWKLSLISEEYSGRLFYAFIYVLSIFTLVNNLNTLKLFKYIFALLIILATYDYYLLMNGNQEVVIFSMICFIMNCFYKLSEKNKINENYYLINLLLIFNLLFWTKPESIIYVFIVISTLLLFFKIKLKKKILILVSSLSLFLLKIFIYKIYNLELSLNSCCYNDFSTSGILNKISFDRILLITNFFFLSLFKNYLLLLGLIFLFLSFFNKKKITLYICIFISH